MRPVLSNFVVLAAPSTRHLVRLLVIPALSLALHSAPALAVDVCNSADLEGALRILSQRYLADDPARRTAGHPGQDHDGWKRKLYWNNQREHRRKHPS